MRTKRALLGIVALGLAVVISGCITSVPPEISGAAKIVNGQMTQLTATEVRALAALASELSPDVTLSLTEEEAQAIVDFLVANNVNSIEDLEALIDQFMADPTSVTIPSALVQLVFDTASQTEITEEFSNQGGGTVGSAMGKLIDGEISTWTPDEVQLIAENFEDLAEEQGIEFPIDPEITDEQAAAIVSFLQANDIDDVEDLEALAEAAADDLSNVVVPTEVQDIIEDLFNQAQV